MAMSLDPSPQTIELDARPILAAGEEPLSLILQRAGEVPVGGVLELTAPFRPVPLYRVMSERGFAQVTESRGPAEWVVRFRNLGITAQATVTDVYERYPATGPVFGEYGMDLCCGGMKSLETVAQAHGVELATLLLRLQEVALTA